MRKLIGGPGLRVPHMGWNQLQKRVDANGDTSPLLDGIDDGAHAYFVHSYAVLIDDDTDACVHQSDHGQRFAAVVGSGKRCARSSIPSGPLRLG